MSRARSVVLIRLAQLLGAMVFAFIAVDLVIAILRPDIRGMVRFDLAVLGTLCVTIVALASSAAVRLHHGRHRAPSSGCAGVKSSTSALGCLAGVVLVPLCRQSGAHLVGQGDGDTSLLEGGATDVCRGYEKEPS